MKHTLFQISIALCIFLSTVTLSLAQQNVELRRSRSVFEFDKFRPARIMQPFGRHVTDSVNIFLKDASLCFLREGRVYKADVSKVLGLQADSAEYRMVGTQMGRIVARRGYNLLLCVTTVNMHQYETEIGSREHQTFFEVIPDLGPGAFLDLDHEALREEDKGYPLNETYYFWIKGEIVPAKESKFKKYVRPEMRSAFRALMDDRFWSWKSGKSLTQLLVYLPD